MKTLNLLSNLESAMIKTKSNGSVHPLKRCLNLNLILGILCLAVLSAAPGFFQTDPQRRCEFWQSSLQPGDDTPERGRYNISYFELWGDGGQSGNLTNQSAIDISSYRVCEDNTRLRSF